MFCGLPRERSVRIFRRFTRPIPDFPGVVRVRRFFSSFVLAFDTVFRLRLESPALLFPSRPPPAARAADTGDFHVAINIRAVNPFWRFNEPDQINRRRRAGRPSSGLTVSLRRRCRRRRRSCVSAETRFWHRWLGRLLLRRFFTPHNVFYARKNKRPTGPRHCVLTSPARGRRWVRYGSSRFRPRTFRTRLVEQPMITKRRRTCPTIATTLFLFVDS